MFDVGEETSTPVGGDPSVRVQRRGGGGSFQSDYSYADGTTGHFYYSPGAGSNKFPFCEYHQRTIPERISNYATFDNDGYYTASFNSWINREAPTIDATCYQKETTGLERQRWKFVKKLRFAHGTVNSVAFGSSLKLARERACFMILNHINKSTLLVDQDIISHFANTWKESCMKPGIQTQMESPPTKESMQGEAIQESDKANNTIVTRDEAKSSSVPLEIVPLNRFASSEPVATFDHAVNRWVPLRQLEVNTTQERNVIVKAYYLPESLYSEIAETINLMPFENYIYSNLTLKMKFVVNANKFQCGKIICSVKFDSSYTEERFTTVQAALCRPHVILDLATNNEGELVIPFRYHRAFMRNVDNNRNVGVRPAKYATVLVQVLSQLRTGIDNPTFVTFRPFITFSSAEFAATSYKISTQMDAVTGIVDAIAPNPALHAILSGVEKLLTNPGKGKNRDKPTDLNSQIVVPHPSRSFGNGKGPMNVIPMRMDPTAMTSVEFVQPFDDDPKTTLAIAQTWGLRSVFRWSVEAQENEEIFNLLLDPSRQERDGVSAFTPVEQMTSLYQFWTGTIELRFDFVSNAFHTGSVMLSVEFSRPTSDKTGEMARVASNYTKTFHLGEQKSVTLRIPYIYDTLWRRSNTAPFLPTNMKAIADEKSLCLAIEQHVSTTLSCRVVNKLLPTQTVSQTIDVLVFMRASPNFRLHSLKQSGLIKPPKPHRLMQFPRDYSLTTTQEENYNKFGEVSRDSIPTRIVTQMDSGEKEDLDPTDQFNLGLDAGMTQTNDAQVVIKDIIRRPVMVISNGTIKPQDNSVDGTGNNSAYFMPIMPPVLSLHTESVSGMVVNFINTPQSRLLSLFKFFRGSCRYTILVHDELSEPVFITHLPHSGVHIIGNALMSDNTDPAYSDPIFASGLHTEVLVPSINPLMTFEVPFDTENNWVCNSYDRPIANHTWRDKGDINAGHIVISSNKQRTFSLWWSAGDDFEFANFYGMDTVVATNRYLLSDNYPKIRTEMESIEEEILEEQDFQDSEDCDPRPVFNVHNTEVMDIKIPKAIASDIQETTQQARDCLEAATIASQELRDTSSDVRSFISDVRANVMPKVEHVFETLQTIIGPFLPVDGGNFKFKVLYEVLWNIATAMVTQSWSAVGLSLLRSLCELLNIHDCLSLVTRYAPRLGHAMSGIVQPIAQADIPNSKSTLVGILVGFIGQVFKVSLDRKKYDNIFDNIADKATNAGTWSYLNQCLVYIQRIYGTLADLVSDALGKMDPEVVALKKLCDNNKAISTFANDVEQMTTPVNYQMYKDPTFRLKYWRTYTQAIQIQRLLATAPSSFAKPGLLKICLDMKKHAEENTTNLISHPCRPEPICIQVNGKAGIGKSYLSTALVDKLSEQVNPDLYRGGKVYCRNPASKFWNGYRGEMAIVYDDFLNLNNSDCITTELGELFMLKTSQDFIPEMAAVEKKEIFAAPLILLLLSNKDFPTCIENVAFTPEAVYRRRDILIKAELKPEYSHTKTTNIPEQVLKEYGHLQFYVHRDPSNKYANYSTTALTWNELLTFLERKFAKHLDKQKKEVQRRLHSLQRHVGGVAVGDIDIEDPFKMFYSLEVQEESLSQYWVPSEALNQSVEKLSAIIDTITRKPETQADLPDDIGEINVCSNCNQTSSIAYECEKHHKTCENCTNPTDEGFTCLLCNTQQHTAKTKFLTWVKQFSGKWNEFIQLVLRGGRQFTIKMIARIRSWIASHRIKAQGEEYNPLGLSFNPSAVASLTKIVKSNLPRCYHQHVIDQVDSVTYYEADDPAWRILVTVDHAANFLNVPLSACCPECPFADYNTYANTIKQYIDMNRGTLLNNVLSYYNANDTNKPMMLKRIPIFLRPDLKDSIDKPWYSYLTGFFAKYKDTIKFLLKVAACCGAVIGFLALVMPSDTAQADLYESGSLARLKRTAKVARSHRQRVVRSENDITDAVESKIMHNYVIMRFWDKNVDKGSLAMVGITAHQAILPKHSLHAITRAHENNCTFTLEPALYTIDKKNHMRSAYTYDARDFRVIKDTDVACMTCPSSYPLFKDIRKFFATDVELTDHLPREAFLVLAPTRSRNLIHVKDVDITGVQRAISSTDPTGESFDIDLAIVYDHSEKGACGSLLLLENRTRPIVAMHVAGEGHTGYGLQLSQETLNNIIRTELITELEEINLEPISEDSSCFLLSSQARVKYLGLVPKKLKPFIPNHSEIQPSLVQGRANLQPFKEPAILAPTDIRYAKVPTSLPPLWHGCNKHGIQTLDFPTSIIDESTNVLWETVFSGMKPVIVNPTRLTYTQAIVGLPGVEFYESIKLNTSAGYPWQRLGKNTLKDSWIEPIRDDTLQMVNCNIRPELIKELQRKENLRKQGIQPITIFTDTLKDETRKKTKVYTPGGTRVFCASPVDYTIAQRQNLLHFCAALMKTRLQAHCGVGINAKGTEWTNLVNYLAEVGLNNVSTFDYSDFGPALNAQVAAGVAKILIQWCKKYVKDINEKELTVIIYECINSVHCAAGTVYQQFAGSPSGASFTTIMNSVVNMLYIYIAWNMLFKIPNKWEIFRHNIRFVVYGDDLIMSVSDEFKDLFNARILSTFFAQYKIVATDASKSDTVVPYTTIFEASFLKRGFKLHPNGVNWLAPLEWISINDTTQWIRKSTSAYSATLQNCYTALMEAHAHGEAEFLKFRNQLNIALAEARIKQRLLYSWSEIDNIWFEGGDWPSMMSDCDPLLNQVDFLPGYMKSLPGNKQLRRNQNSDNSLVKVTT